MASVQHIDNQTNENLISIVTYIWEELTHNIKLMKPKEKVELYVNQSLLRFIIKKLEHSKMLQEER